MEPRTPAADPYLSVVATSRNDDHGGDLRKRMQLFLDGLAAQANRHGVALELILVEWNPPPDRPGLREALRWPPATPFFQARVVVVGPDVHARFDPKGGLPLFQMIAKNVGIRRARGRFILATNVDLLFSDELFRELKGTLDAGVLYRNDRLDVSREIPENAPIDELLRYCRSHVLRVHRAQGTFMPRDGHWVNTSPSAVAVCWRCLRFWLGPFPGTVREQGLHLGRRLLQFAAGAPVLRRLVSNRFAARLYESPVARRITAAFMAVAFGWLVLPVYYLRCSARRELGHAISEKARHLLRVYRVNRSFVRLHTNGCGDFTLLDRETWFRLRAYPEWPLFSWAIDSVFLFQAAASRVINRQLPPERCAYHIDHGGGWTPEDQASLFKRLQDKGISTLSEQDFYRLYESMEDARKKRQIVVYNSESWGLSDLELPEQRVVGPPA